MLIPDKAQNGVHLLYLRSCCCCWYWTHRYDGPRLGKGRIFDWDNVTHMYIWSLTHRPVSFFCSFSTTNKVLSACSNWMNLCLSLFVILNLCFSIFPKKSQLFRIRAYIFPVGIDLQKFKNKLHQFYTPRRA